MDADARSLARAAAGGDADAQAALLVQRMRAGYLDRDLVRLRARLGDPVALRVEPCEPLPVERVRLAAELGHAEALRLHPDVQPADWSWLGRKRKHLGPTLPARVAADWAERTLPVWERYAPDDRRPHEAIAAARAWADCPCEEHRTAAAATAASAADASDASDAAVRASDAAAAVRANAAANAAAAAAAATAANAAYAAAYAAAYYAYYAADADAYVEREWQRLRLAAYLTGEVLRGC